MAMGGWSGSRGNFVVGFFSALARSGWSFSGCAKNGVKQEKRVVD